jgi:hypothetical protein
MHCSRRFGRNERRYRPVSHRHLLLALAGVCTVYMISGSLNTLLQAALLEEREASLKEQLAQLDKKLNGMQRVYMKGVKSSVDSIRAGRAALGGAGKFFSSTAGDTDEAQ